MSTLLDLARFVLGGIALGYLAAFIGAGAVLGVKAGLWAAGPLRITTERTVAVRLSPETEHSTP